MPKWKIVVVCLMVVAAITATGQAADTREQLAFFEKRVRPLLVKHCYRCHGEEEASGGLRLDLRAGWRTGGDSGPAVVPGKPDRSLLLRAVRYQDNDLRMPPPDEGGPLSARQIADLETWIRSGAMDPRDGKPQSGRAAASKSHWAFQPIRRTTVPPGVHPVDFFINQQLDKQGLHPTPRADLRTRIRRAAFDLHGLPPTASQWQTTEDEFNGLIDRLLASPRYGERWGRHWLDVARFADTKDGVLMYGEKRLRAFAYTYRDYVIRSFNEDKPFDRFVIEQLAADQLKLEPHDPALAGMGLLTLGRMFDNNRHDVIDDQIDTVTRGFLGLTVSCARCHDHKFDPIPTADYYSLYGVFASSEEPLDRPRIEAAGAAGQKYETELARQLAAIGKMRSQQHEQLLATARRRVARYLVRVATTEPDVAETAVFFLSILPDQLRPQLVNRWRRLIARRSRSEDPVFGPWHDLIGAGQGRGEKGATIKSPSISQRAADWKRRGVDPRVIGTLLAADPRSPRAVAEAYGKLFSAAIARRSDDSPAGEAGPDRSQTGPAADHAAAENHDPLWSLMIGTSSPFWFPKNQVWYYMNRKDKDRYRGMINDLDLLAVKSPHAAGRAMVVRDTNRLVAPVIFKRGDPTQPGRAVPRRFLRVIAEKPRRPFASGGGRLDLARAITAANNPLTARVLANRIWLHHFGEPLVENPSDFGLRTAAPRHLELLDYLATELHRNGWRVKPLHRLIMTSAAWQRSSVVAGNTTFEEQHRDDPTNLRLWRMNRRRLDLEAMRDSLLFVSGQLDDTMYGRPQAIDSPDNRRRTVYALVERQNIPGVVRNFDFASPDASAGRRSMTTVPQQALFAMNSEFVRRTVERIVKRVGKGKPVEQVATLHRLTLGRQPTDAEAQLGVRFLTDSPLSQYAQVLLMTNEFMFVD